MDLVAGIVAGPRNACAALCTDSHMVGVCQQERITRVRGAAVTTGLPDEAVDTLLQRAGETRDHIACFALAGRVLPSGLAGAVAVDRSLAYASAAFLASPFESAAVLIVDRDEEPMTLWRGDGRQLRRLDCGADGVGLARLYSTCCDAFGFHGDGKEQRLEALARLEPNCRDSRVEQLFRLRGTNIESASNFETELHTLVAAATSLSEKATLASAVQSRIADLLIELLDDVRRIVGAENLCVGGNLFYNSRINSVLKCRGGFASVFIPVDPGPPGLAVGAALQVPGRKRFPAPPFSGPAYSAEEIKQTLDNCKLTYTWASEDETVHIAAQALRAGRLVAWFDGAMEWGARALGARSILANPFAPYVLENLNTFLKRREMWRGYALSGLEAAVHDAFEGPCESSFMECDYEPKDRRLFRHVLPMPHAALRVQTVASDGPPRFRALIDEFGRLTDIPVLVNTSFNGFYEPIVCSPRDAIRVFFGTGVDMLVFPQFVVSK